MASDLNDSACGTEAAEATGIQMVHPPTGTTVCDVLLTCTQFMTPDPRPGYGYRCTLNAAPYGSIVRHKLSLTM